MSELKVFIDTGYEHNSELREAHERFVAAVKDTGAEVIGDRTKDALPETPAEEAEYERDRLETIAEDADAVALWLDGQPPRPRAAIAAGFAAAHGIPVFAMRSEQRATTGENGIPVNLMLPAAITYSRDPFARYDSENIEITKSFKDLARQLIEAQDEHGDIPRTLVPTPSNSGEVYAANPYGFAESTRGFYNGEELPMIGEIAPFKDPWTYAEDLVKRALKAVPSQQAIAWTVLGIRHVDTVRESLAVVSNMDQEPSDVGSVVETGAAAGFGKPVALYRSDFRVISEGPSRFDASIQAAANLWLPRDEAVKKHDNFPDTLEKLRKELQEIVANLR